MSTRTSYSDLLSAQMHKSACDFVSQSFFASCGVQFLVNVRTKRRYLDVSGFHLRTTLQISVTSRCLENAGKYASSGCFQGYMLMHFLRGRNVGCTQDDPTVLMDKYLPSAKLTYANIANCKITLFIGKSSINDPFSIAILVYWRQALPKN